MKTVIVSFLLLLSTSIFAQREELLNNISDAACQCMEGKDVSSNFEMVMGLCIIQAASPYSDEIKSELGIDLSNMDNYEQLGEVVAMSLISRCPSFMEAMMEYMGEEEPLEFEEEDDEEDTEIWSDMDAAAMAGGPEYGGPENKSFITTPIADTNGSGLIKPSITGTVKIVNVGLVNEVVLKTDGGSQSLYLADQISGAQKIKKGAELRLTYRPEKRYNAARGQEELVWIIIGIE